MTATPRLAALAVCCLALAACASGPPPDPLATLQDESQRTATRTRSIERLADRLDAGEVDAATYREQLKRIAWGRNEPLTLRLAAVDALLAHDPADTGRMLALMLPTEPNADVVRRASELAAERGWTFMTPALVRSWARPLPIADDEQRPEPDALAALHPQRDTYDVVYQVFATVPDSDDALFADKTRRAAWEVLGELDPDGDRTAQRIAAEPDAADDDLLAAIQDAARNLHAVPVTREQLEWLTRMRAPEHRAFWNAARAGAARLNDDQRAGLALRHAAPLALAQRRATERFADDRASLLSELRARLNDRTTHTRTAEGAARIDRAEALETHEPDLAWADALHILLIDDALRDPETAADLFAFADRDHRDESTEHGGILVPETNGAHKAVLYPPRPTQRLGDRRFVAAPEMFTEGAEALAHFHFHAQDRRNQRYAGPGPADLAYAQRFGRACVVLTSVDEDTLAADYYAPGRVVVDLGEIRRPASD